MARWLLGLPERGSLQTATFHTLRTYLTPINKQVRKWRRSSYADPVPDVVQDAQKWLSQPAQAPTNALGQLADIYEPAIGGISLLLRGFLFGQFLLP